jgi:hypothetical protein
MPFTLNEIPENARKALLKEGLLLLVEKAEGNGLVDGIYELDSRKDIPADSRTITISFSNNRFHNLERLKREAEKTESNAYSVVWSSYIPYGERILNPSATLMLKLYKASDRPKVSGPDRKN